VTRATQDSEVGGIIGFLQDPEIQPVTQGTGVGSSVTVVGNPQADMSLHT
jgi:hypothetical protein